MFYMDNATPRGVDEMFVQALHAARLTSRLSQAEVARRAGALGFKVTQPVIGKIERGERRVTIGEGSVLARIFAEEGIGLGACPAPVAQEGAEAELLELRAFKRRVLTAAQIRQTEACERCGVVVLRGGLTAGNLCESCDTATITHRYN